MKIRIKDMVHYAPETCNTGGDYGFSTYYEERPDGRFDVTYGTTADFAYCPLCGSFYRGDECSCGMTEPDVVDMCEVNRQIMLAVNEISQGNAFEIEIGFHTSKEVLNHRSVPAGP